MCEQSCVKCGQRKPLHAYEKRGCGYRKTCRKCRNLTKSPEKAVDQVARLPEMPVSVINSFALWFGPVDRSRPLGPTV